MAVLKIRSGGAWIEVPAGVDDDLKAFVFVVTNADVVDATAPRVVVPCPFAGEVTDIEVKTNEDEVCGGTDAIFDVHKILAADLNKSDGSQNGTTIYTTQASRPKLTSVDSRWRQAALPDVVTFADGDYLAVLVDQAGTDITTVTLKVKAKRT